MVPDQAAGRIGEGKGELFGQVIPERPLFGHVGFEIRALIDTGARALTERAPAGVLDHAGREIRRRRGTRLAARRRDRRVRLLAGLKIDPAIVAVRRFGLALARLSLRGAPEPFGSTASLAADTGSAAGSAAGLPVSSGSARSSSGLRSSSASTKRDKFHVGQLQQLDRLLQLRRHDQTMGLTEFELSGDCHCRTHSHRPLRS